MSNEQDKSPEINLPEDEEDVIKMAGAETEEEQNLAVAQARLIGDID
ncbi:hypothetical protein SAMN05216388_1003353 [Halorientalis persicus]|uniref:Uncharacterized protein n=1 Tax=Halorientalis persicus TaxID=1367881 RepID=A0A1H8HDC9_9EURY|nr:hypothetical protein [Halorientalis persicus]SEN54120.1 hypothetical protein SAMN05216388_1003353 [Halorientalis persicus]